MLTLKTYRDKVKGCWTGKNIGGVLGAPFEGFRQINEIDFYVQDLTQGPPPNDDLDLQIVWLAAVERFGRNVNASILGEYWLSFIIPNWVEYGTGKANLRAGLLPPLTGVVDNIYKDSCGCFIRSEIWACLAPGHPELAARYAYEDAIVDHQGEGVFGEVFIAALQSAAFVESDPYKLIDIGLSYIPTDCMLAQAVKKAIACYEQKVDIHEARRLIHNTAPGTFGIQGLKVKDIKKEGNAGMAIGQPGFDAPENVAFVIAGWLYGEGDFGNSLLIANSFGEDTDCTCATLGAILGIIQGDSGLPEKWKSPLNDRIETLCIDKTSRGVWVPKTATELTERVMRAMPAFLGQENCDIFAEGGMTVTCKTGDDLYCSRSDEYLPGINSHHHDDLLPVSELCRLSPYVVRYECPAFRFLIDYDGSVFYKRGEARKVKVSITNAFQMRQQQWVRIRALMPDGVVLLGGGSVLLPLNNLSGSFAETEFEFVPESSLTGKLEFLIEISLEGRHSSAAVKVVLMGKNG